MRRTDPKGVALPPEAFVFGNPVGEATTRVRDASRARRYQRGGGGRQWG